MSLSAKLVALLLLMVGIAAGLWWLRLDGYKAGYQAHKAEIEAAAELQREGNRGRAYAAEKAQVQRESVRTEYLTIIEKELRHEAENLAVCRLDAGDIGMLQRAATCAREDRPASCGSGEQVPAAR